MEHLLTKLKNIQPNKDFQERSKHLILSASQLEAARRPIFHVPSLNNLQLKPFLSLALAGMMLVLSGLSVFLKDSPSLADSLDSHKLAKEAQSLDIQIQLSQIQYYQDSAKKIEIALNQTSGDKNNKAELDHLLEESAL